MIVSEEEERAPRFRDFSNTYDTTLFSVTEYSIDTWMINNELVNDRLRSIQQYMLIYRVVSVLFVEVVVVVAVVVRLLSPVDGSVKRGVCTRGGYAAGS